MKPLDEKTLSLFVRMLELSEAARPFVFDRTQPDRILVDANGTVLLMAVGSHRVELLDAMEQAVTETNQGAI